MRKKGFTLVELIITMVILGVLTGIGGVKYASYVEDARLTEIKSNCSLLEGVELQEQLKGRSIRGTEGLKTGKYATKEGIKDEVVVEKQYKIDESKLGNLGGKIRNVGEYYIGERGVVRYYGELKGEVKGKNPTDPTNPTDPSNPTEPVEPKDEDIVELGDYVYMYMADQGGWRVGQVTDKGKSTYGKIESMIQRKPVIAMQSTFLGCSELTIAPELPSTLISMQNTFAECAKLEVAPVIPTGVVDMSSAFSECSKLSVAPAIPEGVKDLSFTFEGCTSIVTAPVIPSSVLTLSRAFVGCVNLKGELVLNANVTNMYECFNGAVSNLNTLVIKGTATDEVKENLAKTNTKGRVSVWYPKPAVGEVYSTEDYTYTYFEYGMGMGAWKVQVKDKTKMAYEPLLGEIKGYPLTTMPETFKGCTNLIEAPTIPSSVVGLGSTFYGCTKLSTAPIIPANVTFMEGTFMGCTSLVTAPLIPNSVTNMVGTFMGCTGLTTAPVIPSGVTVLRVAFKNCTNLRGEIVVHTDTTDVTDCFNGAVEGTNKLVIKGSTTLGVKQTLKYTHKGVNVEIQPNVGDIIRPIAGDYCYTYTTKGWAVKVVDKTQTSYGKIETSLENIPVKDMTSTFEGCTNLISSPVIPNSVTVLVNTYKGCIKLNTPPVIPANVVDMGGAFFGCTSLKTAPVIPTSVQRIPSAFENCTALTGDFVINGNIDPVPQRMGFQNCFRGAVAGTNKLVIKGSADATTKKLLLGTATTGNVSVG